ncbi:MAG: thioredoxin family protein [Muribaculaceae bacterium]|nr:thioredoxin family protein [Muribaculaceae bacterium]
MIVSCLVAAVSVSAMAAEERSVTFTYANEDLSAWGKAKSEIYDIAIRIEDPALVGKKITGIRALINAYEGLESTSLWLSKELTLEKVGSVKVTVPDTYSAEALPEKVVIPGYEDHPFGQISVSIDTPYEITQEGIYVGYSLTVPAVGKDVPLTDGQKYPVVLSPSENPLSLYVRASKDFLKWLPYNERLGAAAAIYVTLEGELAEYSVGIKQLSDAIVAVDSDFSLQAKLTNFGQVNVSSIGYTYSIAGKTLEGSLDFTDPIVPDLSGETSVSFPIERVSELGDFDLHITIDKVNGQENDNTLASASCSVSVLPFVPVHRPLVEEFTGTWCGWCPRGYIAMELLSEEFGDDVVLAAYHDNDPMQAQEFPLNPDDIGFPSATLNRGEAEDPFYGTGSKGFGMKNEVKASIEVPVLSDVQVEAHWTDEEKTKIAVTADAIFLEDKENAGYKVGFLLICDGLSGKGSSWIQSNYFTGQLGYNGTELEVLTTWPSKIPNLVFNDVVVDTDGLKGVAGSIPENVVYNEAYSVSFAYDIARNYIIQDKDKLKVAAFIINPDGTILNSNKTKIGDFTSVNMTDSDAVEVSAEYYDISGSRVSVPENGVFIKLVRMSDGTIRTEKLLR